MLSNILDTPSLMYLFPIDDFVDAHLKLQRESERAGRPLSGCPLFNDAIGDGHFSAAGSAVWADSVGRRIILLLDREPNLDEPAAKRLGGPG
jgi:hypothetical protein